MKTSNTNIRPRLLTEAIMIASVPLLAYCISYVYEVGYALALGIPTRLISLSSSTLIAAGFFSLVFVSIFFGGAYYAGIAINRKNGDWYYVAIFFSTLGLINIVFGVGTLGFGYFSLVLSALVTLMQVIAFSLIAWIKSRKKSKGLRFSELILPKPGKKIESFESFVKQNIADSPFIVLMALYGVLTVTLFAFMSGHFSARFGSSFFKIADTTDTVVVRIYENRIVTMGRDQQTGCLNGIVEVRSFDANNSIKLEHVDIVRALFPTGKDAAIRCPQGGMPYIYSVPVTSTTKNAAKVKP